MDSEGPQQLFILADTVMPPSNLMLILQGCMVVFLLFLSGIISGSEVAFFSLTPDDLSVCSQSKRKSERLISQLLQRPKRLLATILIFNNLVNVGLVIITTVMTWQIFGVSAQGWIFVTVTAGITVLIVFFGEIIPKVYASNRNLIFARSTAKFMNIASKVFYPLSFLLTRFSSVIERRVKKKGYDISVDELHEALEITTNDTTEEEKEILRGIVNFSTITVKQIMKSRMDITAIEYELDFHQLMDKINKCSFSRIPIYKERIDNMQGILYIKDLLPFIEQDENFAWQKLLRPGYFIPETKKIDALLKDFQDKRVHMAIVVDEYGGTSGLITLEDIIEEIVGEINDEFDTEDVVYNQVNENTFVFEGKTSLTDFCKIIESPLDVFDEIKGESESLGGLLLEINSSMPQVAEKIVFENFEFVIEAVNKKRIKRVRVQIYDKAVEE